MSLSINKIGNTNEASDFPHTLLLTDRKIENVCKIFTNHSSADVKLSKTQISKITHSGGFVGKFLELLLKTCFPLAKSPLILLVKSVLIPLRLTAAAEALVAFGKIHKNMLVQYIIGNFKSKNERYHENIQILEKGSNFLKSIRDIIENERKEQKRWICCYVIKYRVFT